MSLKAVHLETGDGVPVATFRDMTQFLTPPQVIVWGLRTFALVHVDNYQAGGGRRQLSARYREVYAVQISDTGERGAVAVMRDREPSHA